MSPRPQGRGPIAACCAARCSPTSSRVSTASGPWPHCGVIGECQVVADVWSPRPQGRGPIAAIWAGMSWSARCGSPRPQGRGPIAAVTPGARSNQSACVSTASGPWPHCGVTGPVITARHGAVSTASGPWPHCGTKCRGSCLGGRRRLHGLRAVAPLRRRHARPHCSQHRRVSTASGPWPHCGLDAARATIVSPSRSPRPQGRGPIAAAGSATR